MNCPRCNGLMVVDHFIDMQDDGGGLWLRGWRCVSCGDVLDPMIYKHRMIQTSLRERVATKVTELKKTRKSREVVRLSA